MNYVSVCSGIEAATVAWHPLGWNPLLFAEVAKFPSAVLRHHYPSVPNVGDFTAIPPRSDCDMLVGGTPCQAFSIAGLRGGLSDARGNLALEYLRLADRLRARWLLWENVPGVLSSNGGRDFGAILGALGELGYGFAWRVLDAQFIGVPQRRRRVFLVGYLGDWRRAAAVLSERTSMRRDTPSRRSKRDQPSSCAEGSLGAIPLAADVLTGRSGVSNSRRAGELCGRGWGEAGDPMYTLKCAAEHGVAHPVIAFAENSRGEVRSTGGISSALSTGGGKPGQGYPAICFHASQDPISGSVSPVLSARGTIGTLTASYATRVGRSELAALHCDSYRVRRLTPLECERLQGFPDRYTEIPGGSDSARYHALGNSMAVPCMRWLGERIALVDRYAPRLESLYTAATQQDAVFSGR